MSKSLRKSLVATVLAGGVFVAAFGAPTVVAAQEYVSASVGDVTIPRSVPSTVLDTTVTKTGNTDATAAEVQGETAERGLAFTGTDVIGLCAIGAGAIALGAGALVSRRRNADS